MKLKLESGPILLTISFPYVRDWINEHPFKNTPDAYLICNIMTGAPVKPEAMWTMMNQLKNRILKMLKEGFIKDVKEKEKLEYLIKTKKWNPYCLRHSSISSDSDFLPEYALKKKVRWSMNLKQGLRYIKRRIGDDLKNQILVRNGIISESEIKKKPSIHLCPRCEFVHSIQYKICSSCSYPLTPSAFEEIKSEEDFDDVRSHSLLHYFVRSNTNIPCLKNSFSFESDTDAMYQTTGCCEEPSVRITIG